LKKFLRWFVRPAPSAAPNVANYLAALAVIAPPAGLGANGFRLPEGGCYGFVQLRVNSSTSVTIFRIWTLQPGQGHGSRMLEQLCDLADRHGVEICLKVLPFGRKPYPKSREQLVEWYQQYGFAGNLRKMVRAPRRLDSEVSVPLAKTV
jgi:GNAT superfamily N-acetyltransferase